MRPHSRQLSRPWDSPGKNTGVGCHFLLQCVKVKSESEVAQSCPTLHDPMDCSLPGSSVHGIFPGKSTEVGCHCLLPSREEQQVKIITWHAGKRWWKSGKTSHRTWWPKWDYSRLEPGEKRQCLDRGHSLCHRRGVRGSMAHGRLTIWNSWSHFCADWINQAT